MLINIEQQRNLQALLPRLMEELKGLSLEAGSEDDVARNAAVSAISRHLELLEQSENSLRAYLKAEIELRRHQMNELESRLENLAISIILMKGR